MSVVNIRTGDAYDVYIGRAGKGQDGYFGNPCRIGFHCPECGQVHNDGGTTLPCFEAYARKRAAADIEYRSRVAGLKNRVLGCFCKPKPCHGDVLVKLAAEWSANNPLVEELDRLFATKRVYHNQWLGVHQIGFGRAYARYGNEKFPGDFPQVRQVLHRDAQVFRDECGRQPNTLYIQYLEPGDQVKRHRDPKNNLCGTTISYAGDWDGGELVVEGQARVLDDFTISRVTAGQHRIQPRNGSRLWLPCTIDGNQGPWHWTSPVTRGRRYSIIFNLIE